MDREEAMADKLQDKNVLPSTDVSAADGDGFVPQESTVKFLLAMGFPRQLCEQALQRESGNLSRAVELYSFFIFFQNYFLLNVFLMQVVVWQDHK